MFKFINIYKGLGRKAYILFFVQFINRLGDFVIPFLSLYLTLQLGFSNKTAGLVATAAVIAQVPGAMIGGILADHWSRKGTYIIGQGAAAICIFTCGIIKNPYLIVALLIISTFFSSTAKPLLNTMMYDSVSKDKRQAGNSLLYLATNFGVSVGPLIAGFLFENYLNILFIGDAITSFVAVLVVILFIKDGKAIKEEGKDKVISTMGFVRFILKRPELSLFFLIYMTATFIYAQVSFSLPLTLTDIFNWKGTQIYGYLMSINAITVVISTPFIIYKTRKNTNLKNVTLGGIFYALGFGLIVVANNVFIFTISTIVWTMGEIVLSTNCGVYALNRSGSDMRARCASLMMITGSLGRALGVSIMGGFIEGFGLRAVWPVIFIVGILISFCSYYLNIYVKNKDSKLKLKNERESLSV